MPLLTPEQKAWFSYGFVLGCVLAVIALLLLGWLAWRVVRAW